MALNTAIQWCDSTVNPTMGCDGCELWNKDRQKCYAGKLHKRYGGSSGYAPSFEDVTTFPGRMTQAAKFSDLLWERRPEKPWLDGCRRKIFVSDMSDALSEVVTFETLKEEIINTARSEQGQRHDWLWLTKRPKRLFKFSQWLQDIDSSPWPPNLQVGTSLTSQSSAPRLNYLLKVGDESTIRFVSVEPQWERISLESWLQTGLLHWVIQGGESGVLDDATPFDLAWAEELLAWCDAWEVAYFLKQLGRNPSRKGKVFKLRDTHGGDWSEWPEHLRVRELPRLPNEPLLPANQRSRIALPLTSCS